MKLATRNPVARFLAGAPIGDPAQPTAAGAVPDSILLNELRLVADCAAAAADRIADGDRPAALQQLANAIRMSGNALARMS